MGSGRPKKEWMARESPKEHLDPLGLVVETIVKEGEKRMTTTTHLALKLIPLADYFGQRVLKI